MSRSQEIPGFLGRAGQHFLEEHPIPGCTIFLSANSPRPSLVEIDCQAEMHPYHGIPKSRKLREGSTGKVENYLQNTVSRSPILLESGSIPSDCLDTGRQRPRFLSRSSALEPQLRRCHETNIGFHPGSRESQTVCRVAQSPQQLLC